MGLSKQPMIFINVLFPAFGSPTSPTKPECPNSLDVSEGVSLSEGKSDIDTLIVLGLNYSPHSNWLKAP